MTTILVVDDDSEIRDVIHVYLRNEGYRVLEATDGMEALKIINANPVNLAILDVMMPNMDGIKTCLKIRETSKIPIIMLSAKEGDMDKIAGLTTGADDYVTKPFNPLELMARVKAQLRRQALNETEDKNLSIQFQDIIIDESRHIVTVKGEEIALTPLEFSILKLLASNPGKVFSAEKIYETVWKEPFGYTDNTVMVHIRNLREKLEINPRQPQYLKTVWGVGYKIEG